MGAVPLIAQWGLRLEAFPAGYTAIAGDIDIDPVTGRMRSYTNLFGSVQANFVDGASSKQFHGWPLDVNGDREVTVSYDPSARKWTITAVSGSTFNVWVNGKLVTVASPYLSDAHASTDDQEYFFKLDKDGAFVVGTTVWDLRTEVPIAYCYYNSANTPAGIGFYELHDYLRDPQLHLQQHLITGAITTSPATLTGSYTVATGPASNAANQFGVVSTTVRDEDISLTLDALAAGGPYTILYRSGVGGPWLWDTTPTLPYLYNTGTDNVYYNLNTGGTWSLTEVTTTNRYFNMWVMQTTSLTATFETFIVMGQALYTSLAAAQAENVASISWGSLTFQEISPLYQMTMRYNVSYTGADGKARIESITRLVGSRAAFTAAAGAGIHGALSGRSDPAQHPLAAIGDDNALVARIPFVDSGGALTTSADLTWNDSTKVLTVAGSLAATKATLALGTITTTQQLINSSVTWDNAAITFVAEEMNVTDTASNASSYLKRMIVGGATQWQCQKNGGTLQRGSMDVGYQGAGTRISVNRACTLDSASYIEFIADTAVYTTYGLRLIRNAGENGTGQILHRGTGKFSIICDEAAAIALNTDSVDRLLIDATGIATFSNTTAATSSTTGALVVAGGVGISGSLYIGSSEVRIGQTTGGAQDSGYIMFNQNGTSGSRRVCIGGDGNDLILGSDDNEDIVTISDDAVNGVTLKAGYPLFVLDTTDATSKDAASVVFEGGLALEKSLKSGLSIHAYYGKAAGVTGQLLLGATDNSDINGWYVQADADGTLYVDHKAETGEDIVYRFGVGAQYGYNSELFRFDSSASTWEIWHTTKIKASGATNEGGELVIARATDPGSGPTRDWNMDNFWDTTTSKDQLRIYSDEGSTVVPVVITDTNIFLAQGITGRVEITGNASTLELNATGGSTDQKIARLNQASDKLQCFFYNDARSLTSLVWDASRQSGTYTADKMTIHANLRVQSGQSLSMTQVDLSSGTVNGVKTQCIVYITVAHASNQYNLHASPSDGDTIVIANKDTTNAAIIGAQSSKNIRDLSAGTAAATFNQPVGTIRTYVYDGTGGEWIVG